MNEKHEAGDLNAIDAILEEVRRARETGELSPQETPAAEDAPARDWSMDEIDRLIAQTVGEDYEPSVAAEPWIPDEPAAQPELLPGMFSALPTPDPEDLPAAEEADDENTPDDALFTVAPILPSPEIQDISSDSGEHEMDGQEVFEQFDEDSFADFEIDTILMPEDIPAPAELRYGVPVRPAPEAPAPAPQPAPEAKKLAPEAKAPAPARPLPPTELPTAEELFRRSKTQVVTLDSNGHVDVADYKTRFFSKLQVEDPEELEVAPEGPVDKSGIVVSMPEQTGADEQGLEPLPQVLAAEEAKEREDQRTRRLQIVPPVVKKKEARRGDNVDGQIVLTGFDTPDQETLPEIDDETDVEDLLQERRREKAKNFHLTEEIPFDGADTDFTPTPEERAKEAKAEKKRSWRERLAQEPQQRTVKREYSAPSERTAIHRMLTARNNRATISAAIVGGIQLLMLLFNLIPVLSQATSGPFAQNSVLLCVINALLLIGAAAADSNRFLDGLSALLRLRPTADSAVSLAIVIALLQNTLAAMASGTTAEATVFSVAAVFGVVIQKLTEKLDAMRILGNFEVCSYKYEHNMYAVHPLENESEIFELGRGLMMGNPELLYSSKVSFPTDFMRNSEEAPDEDRLARLLVPAVLGVSIVVGIISAILNGKIMVGLSAVAGTFCLGTPIFIGFIPAFISRIHNRTLNSEGTMIVNVPVAEDVAGANAVVLDAADVFDHSRCTMHGMKSFNAMRMDSVLLYAAALVIKSGGPLRDCFEHVIDGRQDLLPQVKELTYEDKLGISARISEQKVLMGNRNLMVHHNVRVPEKTVEEKYAHSGRKIIYLAVEESCVAMFVVSYAVDAALAPYFETLEDNGMQVLVRSNDVNVTEELIARSFDLPAETFKVLSAVSGKLFKRRRDAVCDKLPAGIVHDGRTASMLRAVAAACSINAQSRTGRVLQILLSALGCIISAALFCTDIGFSGVTAFLILLAFFAAVSAILFFGRSK
ncbi:MAG: hypothetical protein IK080_07935 [Clostridia bacterium]|nr:hypothetical protein [Clostridia bacterium]